MKNIAKFIAIFFPSIICAQSSINYYQDSTARIVPSYKDGQNLLVNCCSGTAANNNFSSAIPLTINAAAINGNTCGSTLESGESKDCNANANQSVWYNFVATATVTYVVIDITGTGTGCFVGSAVWKTTVLPTGSCHPVSCQSADYGPTKTNYQVNTIIGATYYIQIMYGSGGACGTGGCFKINVTNTNPGSITNAPSSNSCSTANNTCWFSSPPTSAQVTSGCTQYVSSQGPNIVNSIWLQFTTGPNSSTVNINGLITSNCGVGNIDWFTWTLYDATCITQISCGTYPTLSIAGVACSTTYNILITWETAGCTWSNWYWYLNAPNSPPPCTALPIQLTSFTGTYNDATYSNVLQWGCAVEINNDYFILQRSTDGVEFSNVCTIQGAGNSMLPTSYYAVDNNFTYGQINYYRLKQVDYNGLYTFYQIIDIDNTNTVVPILIKTTNEIGQQVSSDYKGFVIEIYNNGVIKKKIR